MTLPNVPVFCSLGILSILSSARPAAAQSPATSGDTKTSIATSAVAATPSPSDPSKLAWESSEVLNADLLKMELVLSRTAQVFHVVDQLSQWSKSCHRQYINYFGGSNGSDFTDDDRLMLQKHVAIREKHGWGQGLEQTFYSPLDFKGAADEGITAGRITAEEAASELEVLNYFAPRVDSLIEKESASLNKFIEQLKAERLPIAVFTRQVSRLCGNRRYKVPVYLIVNPHPVSHGSGAAGGRIILEVPRYGDAYTTLMRTVLSVFVDQYADEINKAVTGVDGLDAAMLSEAISTALVPGLLRPANSDDTLMNRVAHDLESKKPISDNGVLQQRFALMLRPSLAAALPDKSQTMPTFIGNAVAVWRSLNELQRASSISVSPIRASKAPSIFVFGELSPDLADYFQVGARNLFTRPHKTEAYQELLGQYSKPNDTVVLVVTSDTISRIPVLFRDLLPLPMTTIQERLTRGESFAVQGTARQLKVVLLAAPKPILLESLIRTNRTMWQ